MLPSDETFDLEPGYLLVDGEVSYFRFFEFLFFFLLPGASQFMNLPVISLALRSTIVDLSAAIT